jgi:hypothetical protein
VAKVQVAALVALTLDSYSQHKRGSLHASLPLSPVALTLDSYSQRRRGSLHTSLPLCCQMV